MTAVEWLLNELSIAGYFPYGIPPKIEEQAKEMEKEQMCSFAEFVATHPNKNININGEMLHSKSKYDGAERTVDLLETFKSE